MGWLLEFFAVMLLIVVCGVILGFIINCIRASNTKPNIEYSVISLQCNNVAYTKIINSEMALDEDFLSTIRRCLPEVIRVTPVRPFVINDTEVFSGGIILSSEFHFEQELVSIANLIATEFDEVKKLNTEIAKRG